ncbi:MAG: hypothetical protein LLG04_08725 [Parachlamydia sp.]|nr:hypothetical protein [Parachlamydia sp.]
MQPVGLQPGNPLSMKPEQAVSVEGKMRPGKSSVVGFLGLTDSLVECCRQDAQMLARLNITYKQIADKLEGLVFRTVRLMNESKNFKSPALLDGRFRVMLESSGGHQDCPFPCNFNAWNLGSWDLTVENIQSGKKMAFPGLIVHLIREHGFFEGDTSYRLDPATACSVLELKSGEDYTPKTVHNYRYRQLSYTDRSEEIEEIKSKWLRILETMQVGEGTYIYLVEVLPDPKNPSEISRDGKTYNARLYIHNTTGETLPDEANVFGIELDTLHRASRRRDFLTYQILPLTKHVLNPQDRIA